MSKKWEPDSVFDVLASEEARKILALTSVEPMSAQELAERLEVSEPTVYRRVNVLEEYDFLRADTRIDRQGNHFETYSTSLRRVEVGIDEGSFTVDLRLQRDLVEQFESFWRDLESGGSGAPDPAEEASFDLDTREDTARED